MLGRLTLPCGQSFHSRKPTGRREGEVSGIEGAEEAAIEFDVDIETATGVEA